MTPLIPHFNHGAVLIRLTGLHDHPSDRYQDLSLLTALAYQSNELDSEIEQLKVDVLQELEHSLAVSELGRAIPATVVVRTTLLPKVSELTVTSAMTFRFSWPVSWLPPWHLPQRFPWPIPWRIS